MNEKQVIDKFEKIGARATVTHVPDDPPNRRGVSLRSREFSIDISEANGGEAFEIRVREGTAADMSVLAFSPKERHLLLMVREPNESPQKFLCGHDERHWFVAAVPNESVRDVKSAMEALKPEAARESQNRRKVKSKHRNKRRNAGFVRQGEWFFIPAPTFIPESIRVLRNEPLRRGAGKPHMVELLVRTGGETVHVCRAFPNGLTPKQYKQAIRQNPELKKQIWQTMSRNPEVFVKGRVSHSDHKTIKMKCWHRVEMNTESNTPAMANVAFLD